MKKSRVDRFWEKVIKAGDDECWHWTGARLKTGHGQFFNGKKVIGAHRYCYEMHEGQIPLGMMVCHSCDVPFCVNPRHLFLGMPSDNMRDRDKKGRQAFGERQGCSKLTSEQVKQIRNMYNESNISQRSLAAQFNVNQRAIWAVLSNETWRHV